MEFSNHFLAKCFSSYFGAAMYKDKITAPITGTVIDGISHFGLVGWQIKLMPLSCITKEHAQRILEIRTGKDLDGWNIDLTRRPDQVTVVASQNGVGPIFDYINFKDTPIISAQESEYLKGHGYDVGFSYVPSLIFAKIGFDASTLPEPRGAWNRTVIAQDWHRVMLDNLKFCSNLAIENKSPEHIGAINALIAAEQLGQMLPFAVSLEPMVSKMMKFVDTKIQSTQN